MTRYTFLTEHKQGKQEQWRKVRQRNTLGTFYYANLHCLASCNQETVPPPPSWRIFLIPLPHSDNQRGRVAQLFLKCTLRRWGEREAFGGESVWLRGHFAFDMVNIDLKSDHWLVFFLLCHLCIELNDGARCQFESATELYRRAAATVVITIC